MLVAPWKHARRSPSPFAAPAVSEVAESARRAATLVTQALGVPVSTRQVEDAPLVTGAPETLTAELRTLMVQLVIGQRARWRGAHVGSELLEVNAAPVEDAPASLRVRLTFGDSAREVTVPIAGAQAL